MTNDLMSPAKKSELLLQRAKAYAKKSRAENTLDTYASLWKQFVNFCRTIRATALPCSPATVCQYLTERAERHAAATLETDLAAIAFRHQTSGLTDPTKDEAVTLTLDGLQREYGTAQHRKAPFGPDQLRQMLALQSDNLRGVRNRALLLLGYACALRRSELVALQVKDVHFRPDQMVVTIRRSKTDQRKQEYQLHVPRITSDEALCPVRALQTWLDIAQISDGPIFRGVTRWEKVSDSGLTDQVVADVVKEAAQAIGIDPDEVSGHSLRRSPITDAARKKVESLAIRKVSRHKSERMLDIYTADDEAAQLHVIRTVLGQNDKP